MKPNPAADRVRTWDRLWQAYVHALQTRDGALLADAKRAIATFDREHHQPALACGDRQTEQTTEWGAA